MIFVATKINMVGGATGVEQMRQDQRLAGSRTVNLLRVESMRDPGVH